MVHLERAKVARHYYNLKQKEAADGKALHLSFDYAQQVYDFQNFLLVDGIGTNYLLQFSIFYHLHVVNLLISYLTSSIVHYYFFTILHLLF